MGKVTVEKIKKVMSDLILHRTLPSLLLHFRARPAGHGIFGRRNAGYNTNLDRKSLLLDSMVPSMIDGIRLGRSPETQMKWSDATGPSTSTPNVRTIPIRLIGSQSQRSIKTCNKTNPIVLDDDVTDIVDCTVEDSSADTVDCTVQDSSVTSKDSLRKVHGLTIQKSPVSKIIVDDEDVQEVIHLDDDYSTGSKHSSPNSSTGSHSVTNTANSNPVVIDDIPRGNKKAVNLPGVSSLQPAENIDLKNDGIDKEDTGHFEELNDSPPPSYPIYDMLITKLARENRKIHYITGDGNCFFRAISKIVYGSEDFHTEMRCLVIDIIVTNSGKFAQFIDGQDIQKHIEKMSADRCWATTCEIYAAATVLQTDIFILTPDHTQTSYSWLLFKPTFKIPDGRDFIKYQCCITLCNTNGMHYDLVMPDHGKCNCFMPHPELEGIKAVIDLS